MGKSCLGAHIRIKNSCLIAQLYYARLFLCLIQSCVYIEIFWSFFWTIRSRARKHDFYTNFFFLKKNLHSYTSLWFMYFFSRYKMFMQYYFILLCQPLTGIDNLQKLHCMQQNDVMHGGNLQLSNTIGWTH